MTVRDFKKGFTLIELLMVVGIISILAAIAIPNFLEAQIRSKISRVKSDMRTISTALEAYMVDNNRYPHRSLAAFSSRAHIDRGSIYACTNLSTPIAYITTTRILDPLVKAQGMSSLGNDIENGQSVTVYYVNVDLHRQLSDLPSDYSRPKWMLFSVGPDNLKGPNMMDGSEWFAAYYAKFEGVPSLPADFHDAKYMLWNYDATNGTVSFGDIMRWQGE